jgi:hypothetical protein
MRQRGQRGQTAPEYLGMVLVVAGIIAAIVLAGPGKAIASAVERAVCGATGAACGPAPGRQPVAGAPLLTSRAPSPSGWGQGSEQDLGTRDLARRFGQGKTRMEANRFYKSARGPDHDLPAEEFRAVEYPNGYVRLTYREPANNTGYGKLYVRELNAKGDVMRSYKVSVRQNEGGEWQPGQVKWERGGPERYDGALSKPDGSLKDPIPDECACTFPGHGGRWVTDGKGNERFVEAPESGEYPGPIELVPGEDVDPEPLPVA